MSPKRIVVIGGAHGGPRAAACARQYNDAAHITLLEKASSVTWVQASLRYHLEDSLGRLSQNLLKRQEQFSRRYRSDVRTSHEVLSIDLDAGVVVAKTATGDERFGFDTIIFAGGARSSTLDIDGLTGPFVAHFRNLVDLNLIQTALRAGVKKAVVIGAGLMGVEAAEGLRACGLDVTVVEKSHRILPYFSLNAAHAVALELKKRGVTLLLSDEVINASARSKMGFKLTLKSGQELEADLVIVCVGQQPQTKLLGEAGAALQKDGSVRVNAYMETTLPGVFACGSAVSVPQILTRERIWIPTLPVVERTARVAGKNAAIAFGEEQDSFKPIAGTRIVPVGSLHFARTGLSESEARYFFKDANILTITTLSRAAESWLGGDDLTIVLIVERSSKIIVGAEVWGQSGVERRIDILSCAILEGWSVAKLVDLDMVYIASEGPAFDPLKEAGARAQLVLQNESKIVSTEQLMLWNAQGLQVTILDVSEGAQFTSLQSLPFTVNQVPISDLATRKIAEDHRVVVCSQTGRTAMWAQQLLARRGLDAYCLDGGIVNWEAFSS